MTTQQIQEQMSKSYVGAIAAMSGLICSTPEIDDGVDGTFRNVRLVLGEGQNRKSRYRDTGHAIDYQLKATTNLGIVDNEVVYSLEVKNYNDLVDKCVGTPRILILYYMPKDRNDWIKVNGYESNMRYGAWWCSLHGEQVSENKQKVTIRFPETQRLTPKSLRFLMDEVVRGAEL